MPSWLQVRVQQIPEIDTQIADLLWKMHAEADNGGLFAGDPSFKQLSAYIDSKGKTLNQLCILSYGPLPLSPALRSSLDQFISDLQREVETLGEIETEIDLLIKKANGEGNSAKKPD